MAIETEVEKFQVGMLKLEIYPSGEAACAAAARAVAKSLLETSNSNEDIGVIFATGTSQIETLRVLTSIRDLPWNRVLGFHLDEYIGIEADHSASFRHYLKVNLTDRVDMREFFAIDGSSPNPDAVCRDYAQRLRMADPRICMLGVGENGHLAFNDPGEADFEDPEDVKIVELDAVSRQQQASEGWFKSIEDVPKRAITVTIPAILRVPELVVMILGSRKAHILKRVLTDAISTDCPATILRRHPDATVYLDRASTADLDEVLQANR
jgi:glucosamine-6-phosphate deaminase